MVLQLTPARVSTADRYAIGFVLAGGLLGGVLWLVGLVLLWRSQSWTARQKLVGTLAPPGGLVLVPFAFWHAMFVADNGLAPAAPWFCLAVLLLMLAVGTAVHLARVASR